MPFRFRLPIACAFLLAASTPALHAQDVEMLGRIHGTRPPQAYYDLKARDAGAFEFERAWARRGLGGQPGGIGTGRPALILDSATPAGSAPMASLGQRAGSVRGTFRFPLILGLFSDSPAPTFAREEIQREFFDGPN